MTIPDEKNALQEVTSNLLDVAKSSENLNVNSQTVEESVNNITNMSGELKNLTDGFDVIHNLKLHM